MFLPSDAHAVLHGIMLEPPVPNKEVMHHCIEVEHSYGNMFSVARENKQILRAIEHKKSKHPGKKWRYFNQERLERGITETQKAFWNMAMKVLEIPQEFHFIDLTEYDLGAREGMYAVSERLGEIALRQATNRVRETLAPISA